MDRYYVAQFPEYFLSLLLVLCYRQEHSSRYILGLYVEGVFAILLFIVIKIFLLEIYGMVFI